MDRIGLAPWVGFAVFVEPSARAVACMPTASPAGLPETFLSDGGSAISAGAAPWWIVGLFMPAKLRLRPAAAHRAVGHIWRLLDDAEALRGGGRFHARAHVELGEDARYVHAGGLFGHEELFADLTVGSSVGDELEHGELALGQAESLDRVIYHRSVARLSARQRQPPSPGERFELLLQPGRAAVARDPQPGGQALLGELALSVEQVALRFAQPRVGLLERHAEPGPTL